MLSLEIARKLKQLGLQWQPRLNDFFAIPDRDMDERVFVISDMLTTIERLDGRPVIAFQGASEWALDNLVIHEAVWLPSESQLRQALQTELLSTGRPEMQLHCGLDGCRCSFQLQGERRSFRAEDASEAYALALLALLQSSVGG